jgi:hypothetical protein
VALGKRQKASGAVADSVRGRGRGIRGERRDIDYIGYDKEITYHSKCDGKPLKGLIKQVT